MIKKYFALLSLTLLLALNVKAQTPPPEKLLPADTLLVVTVPDLDKARAEIKSNPASQLYSDPAMQPFIKKLLAKWNSEIVAPLEREMGIKFEDYLALAKGQLTFAIVRDGWEGEKDKEPAVLLLIDSKDKGSELESKLTELRKRWTDTGKQVKTEKIRDVDFYTVILPPGEMDKIFTNAFPSKKERDEDADTETKKADKPTEITIGRSGSLFLMGNSKRVFEKVLIKQSGGSLPSLDEVPNYQGAHNALFRDSMFYTWMNFQSIYDIILKAVAADQAPTAADDPMPMPSADKIMDALGLRGLKTLAISGQLTGEGSTMQFHLGVPQAQRKGIFQLLVPETKDAAPPAFISTDVTKFMRWRLSGQKLWSTIESTVASISPQMGGLLQMTLGAAGKDKDPNFDLKKQLIGNLGDDVISYEKAPTGTSIEQLSNPPSIVLVGSANAEQLANAIRTGSGFLASPMMGGDKPTEREFLGKKIFMLPMPPTVSADGTKPVERSLHYVASGGYVAFSTQPAMVEEFVRSAQGGGRPLSETPGLSEAAQKVGGMSNGLLIYENQAATAKVFINALRKNPEMFDVLFSGGMVNDEGKKRRAEWFDFALLPEFSAIEKYFYFSVGGFTANEQGLTYKFYGPTPPKAK